MVDSSGFDWGVIYHSLIHSIRSNTGYGFHNNDQGHPAYVVGAKTGDIDHSQLGDSPEENPVYKILSEISRGYGQVENLPVIETWQQFCQLAYEGYLDNKKTPDPE